jgi:hypothetical protein
MNKIQITTYYIDQSPKTKKAKGEKPKYEKQNLTFDF